MNKRKSAKGGLSRRDFLRAGLLTGGLAATAAAATKPPLAPYRADHSHLPSAPRPHEGHEGGNNIVGDVLLSIFDPTAFLTQIDRGKEPQLGDGGTLREREVIAQVKDIEVAPGVWF